MTRKSSQNDRNVGNVGNVGVLLVSKDSENLRDVTYRVYGVVVKEENNVTEEVLVRDVLYACQGIDRRAKLLELSSEGMYGVSSVRGPVGDRLRHFSLADDCSVADNGGHLVDDVDLREVHADALGMSLPMTPWISSAPGDAMCY
nr:gamma-tubulin complex component 3 [Tanacetum cinerariifolium]